ncbi:unnamed protein product [Thlaspi arvense]|uniref:Matrin-type domain-containing protein n=1 Tax=Thlaspi arvense TaxID=13288 RepID=A0AAU9R8N7_THLAR|nr:unnamed protein product [Thlaspi arvense]
MIHRRCIYLPRVIKINRHQHRLSHTSSLVPCDGDLSCGVCRKPVDINYGSYSCNRGCHYAVHSKCATKDQVWDGIDLEGVPEEEEEVIEPFVRIDEETIQHFSHDHHHLKIHGNDSKGNHENKFCQACVLPMTVSDRFYSCVQCECVLHETCASLPRQKHHPIHKHPLTLLHPFSSSPTQELVLEYHRKGFFVCDGCGRVCCGFVYRCMEKNCHFQLDARCASLPDPLIHDCHPHGHPLFFNLTRGECMGCKCGGIFRRHVECIQCNSFLCLRCATLPSLAHYKHDKHPLTLCCGEEEVTDDLQYWCEFCEGKLDATEWFYTCDSCRVTLHVTCLLGQEMYLKPNHIIKDDDNEVEIARNSGITRPMCDTCRRRCGEALYWVSQGNKWCDFCKIWIQNNTTSIRNHELGKRHRECVDKKLTDMREKSAAKDKELKKNEKLLQQIEAKATRSYQKDIATAQEVAKANGAPEDGTRDWVLDSASGYYYNQTNGLHYDSKSGFYYSDSIGHWVTQDEAYAAVKSSSDKGAKVPLIKKPVPSSEAGPSMAKPPGRLVTASLNPKRTVKGAASSVDIGNNKRKRLDEKPKKVSAEEKAALKAREAARKRVEDREKPLLGLYNRPF